MEAQVKGMDTMRFSKREPAVSFRVKLKRHRWLPSSLT